MATSTNGGLSPKAYFHEHDDESHAPQVQVENNTASLSHSTYPSIMIDRHALQSEKLDDSLARTRLVAPSTAIANPAPLGLSAFALTTFLLSLFNAEVLDITVHNLIVGSALFYGGIVQVLAGMWEFRLGNVFGATAFSSYGAFWLSFAVIFIPNSGILEAYKGKTDQLENALGLYLLAWTIFTLMLLSATLKKSVAMVALFATLELTFIFLTIGKFTLSSGLTKAGGWLGFLTALIAWYNALAGIVAADEELSEIIYLPVGSLSRKDKLLKSSKSFLPK